MNKKVSKVFLWSFVSIMILCVLSFVVILCVISIDSRSHKTTQTENHNVVLSLVKDGKVIKESILTSRSEGSSILNPNEYKIFSSIVDGYVVVGDCWYDTISMNSKTYFPIEMPNNDLNLFAEVRPLTNIDSIDFLDSNAVESFFSSKSELQDSIFDAASTDKESSYYEIIENTAANIKNVIRYYPKAKSIILIRGYVENTPIVDNKVLTQDGYNIGLTIDLINKNISCKGIYTRTGIYSSTYSVNPIATVEISYNIPGLSIDKSNKPLVPNFATIEYTHSITDATDLTKMQKLWNSDGYAFAEKCYDGLNSLLSSLSKNIIIFQSK